jgi:hypothetical protein
VNADFTAIKTWANGNIGTDNILDSSITDMKIGSRTISDASVPVTDINSLNYLLNNLANRIKAITGASGWKSDPVQTISQLKSNADTDRNNFNNHTADSVVHTSATERQTNATHIADGIRHIVDSERQKWNTHIDSSAPHSGHLTATHVSSGDHDSRYYTKTQIDNGVIDTRFLTYDVLTGVGDGVGATIVGSPEIAGVTGTTVSEQLNSLKDLINASSTGDIADGSIGPEKLTITPYIAKYIAQPDYVNKPQHTELNVNGNSLTFGYDAGTGDLTSILEKNAGGTVIKSTTFTYTSGDLTQVVEVAGGTTVTTTFAYTNGDLTSITKVVA